MDQQTNDLIRGKGIERKVIDFVEVDLNIEKKKSELKMLNVQTYLP